MHEDDKDPTSPILYKDAYFPQMQDQDIADPSWGLLGGPVSFTHDQLYVFGKELLSGLLTRLEPDRVDTEGSNSQDVSMELEG